MSCIDGGSVIRTDTLISLQEYSIRCDSVKSRDIFISLRMVKPSTPTDNYAHLLAGDHLGERFGYFGIIPLAHLDAPRACSRRSQGYVRMSITPLRSSGLLRPLDNPHLVSSNVEHEHVS